MGTADLQAHFLQDPGHTVTHSRRGSQAQIHNAKGGIQTAACLLGHQLTHTGNAERSFLHRLRHHFKGLPLHSLQCSVDNAGTGNTHVNDLLRFTNTVESAGHKGVILHGIAKYHQLGASQSVLGFGKPSRLLNDPAHKSHSIHIDAGLGGTHIYRGTHQIGICQRLGNRADQIFICLRHPLLHQSGVTANKIDAASLGCPVQGKGKRQIVPGIAGAGYQSHRRHGNALIDDGNTKLPLNILAGFYQLFCITGDFVIDLIAGLLRIGVAAAQQRNTHGNGPDIQMLLIDHFNGGEDLLLVQHSPLPFQILCIASKISSRWMRMEISIFLPSSSSFSRRSPTEDLEALTSTAMTMVKEP